MTTPAARLPHHRAEGPATAPPLLLGPSLGTSTALWDGVAPELSATHRVVRWDLPGHGGSPAGLIGPGADVADLASLVLRLADSLSLDRFSYAGVSLGGAVGLWLAVHHPERLDRLAVVCSSAHFGDPGPWRERAARVRAEGIGPVAESAAARWFTPGFTAPRLLDDLLGVDPSSYAACCDALAAYDLRPALYGIRAPTLVIAGREDPATPPAHAREIADAVPGATLIELPRASHLAPAERPAAVREALRAHFVPGEPGDGTAVRREVLGDAHVDRAQAATTAFTARFQDFITRYAWGEVWTDPTLSRRERSLITLTALVAHGHHDELAMHVRAAVRNGLTPEEIGAALLQTGVYCGVPAANSAFAVAKRVLAETE
ncbi:3-oxoadipate enol-lactonase [Streptomyces sp. B1I3]|uniref:bifunctional 3-oxoadipate enol-lactonase/4-carboxymuconolactone decarboxylase PcaDC n=1 Tax=Streptomyces sp. B1I3 TaxID=3042264 RepID=UPI002780D310|nr:3-oxoadipate enol-lactonase [Streptomyces sp. B1I3]MDQ0792776.1 3-oxoadipate enol-lactonase/4-carboxymuconolactone decarboxylase [Streptomyces sp. B1I3]